MEPQTEARAFKGAGKAIAEKVLAIKAALRTVEKDGENKGLKYKYTSGAALNAKVNKALCDNRVIIADTKVRPCTKEMGAPVGVVSVHITFVLMCADTEQTVVYEGIGSGSDMAGGDKGSMKAETAASKYLSVLAFQIGMGTDPEADEPTPAPVSPLAAFERSLAGANTPDEVCAAWLEHSAAFETPKAKAAAQTKLKRAWTAVGGDHAKLGPAIVAAKAALESAGDLDGVLP